MIVFDSGWQGGPLARRTPCSFCRVQVAADDLLLQAADLSDFLNDWSVGEIAWSRGVILDIACGCRFVSNLSARSYVLDHNLRWLVLIVRFIDCFVVFVDSMLGCKRLALMLTDDC